MSRVPHHLRRVQKEWAKGTRAPRAGRLDDPELAEDYTTREKMRPRAVTIETVADVDLLPLGQVIRVESGRYDVRPVDRPDELLACRIKRGATTENERSTLVVIGDNVRFQPLEDGRGIIHHVELRRTRMGRAAVSGTSTRAAEHVIAANVDLLICTVSADRPDFRRTIVDRFIVAALVGEIEPVIVVNKIDTAEGEIEELLREEMAVYETIGYSVLFVSAATGLGMDELLAVLAGRTAALVGQSGVGKSSLANTLTGGESRRTGEVRERDRRGSHTTVDSAMLPLPGGGYLVDTPGIREFGIWDLAPEELDGYFVEFLPYIHECRYTPCTHTHEPDCAVRAAAKEGEIDPGRYASYLAIFESLGPRKGR